MDNSLLVSLSHQLAAYRAMDVLANNIANVSTPGFKRESSKFEEYIARMRPAEGQKGLQNVSFVKDAGTLRDQSQGVLAPGKAVREDLIENGIADPVRAVGGVCVHLSLDSCHDDAADEPALPDDKDDEGGDRRGDRARH